MANPWHYKPCSIGLVFPTGCDDWRDESNILSKEKQTRKNYGKNEIRDKLITDRPLI